MADVVVDTQNKGSKELVGQGIRAYILQDYSAAVVALSKASELLAAEHGDDLHDSLADVYQYYGKALLGLSREESEALGDAVPKNNEEDSEGEDEEESAETEEGGEKENDEVKADEKAETKEQGEEEESSEANEPGPSCSVSKNGESEAAEGTEEKAGDDEPTDLQVAWEVLELAKKIYQKHGEEGKKNLAETLVVLGEISLESENFQAAINDIKEGLEIQKQLFGKDSRTVAETYYKLGIAYSTNTQIDEAIRSFNDSLEYLQNRINCLEKVEPQNDEVTDEIKEIKGLIPDIEEKIADMKSYKDETLKQIMSAVAVTQPANAASSSEPTSKPATDISHLVKRKRKLDEIVEESEKECEGSPSKKPPVDPSKDK